MGTALIENPYEYVIRLKRNPSILLVLTCLYVFGALFFLAWEANGRYILPYAIFMIPYAGYGAHLLTDYFINCSKKITSDQAA